MNALHNLMTYAVARLEAFITRLQHEEGSEVVEAAGVALLSAALVGAILGLRGSFTSAITSAFHSLISKLH